MDTLNLKHVTLMRFGKPEIECTYCGALGWSEENRGSNAKPHFGILCCMQGKYGNKFTSFRNTSGRAEVNLPEVTPGIRQLLQGEDALAVYYRKNIRSLNAAMSLGSLQVTDKTVKKDGPASFKVSGQLFRRFGSLLNPHQDRDPCCIQTYFYDPKVQVDIRIRRLEGMTDRNQRYDRELFQQLYRELRQYNNLLQQFLTVEEHIRTQNLNAEEILLELHETERTQQNQPGDHQGRYHLPTANEIALIMPNNLPANAQRSLVCQVRGSTNIGSLRTFSHLNGKWDACGYPLLFPYGTTTWFDGFETRHMHTTKEELIREKLTIYQYFRHYTRWKREPPTTNSANFNHLIYCCKLWQQYIVDVFAKAEISKLNWIRTNQKQIRADLYQGVQDSLNRGDVEKSGTAVVLPGTLTCGPRWYHKKFKDAMALVRVFGKPTFFLTITLNINCEEVKNELKHGQTAYDRPDVLCRVFQMKKNAILKEISEGLFGPMEARTSVIEFQKRG